MVFWRDDVDGGGDGPVFVFRVCIVGAYDVGRCVAGAEGVEGWWVGVVGSVLSSTHALWEKQLVFEESQKVPILRGSFWDKVLDWIRAVTFSASSVVLQEKSSAGDARAVVGF